MRFSDDFQVSREGSALTLYSSNRTTRWGGAVLLPCAVLVLALADRADGGAIGPTLVVGIALVLGGLLMLARRDVTTVFETGAGRVHIHASLLNGWVQRRHTYAFDEIVGLGIREYGSGSGYSYLPVLVLRTGKRRWLAVSNGGYPMFATAIQETAERTGLTRVDDQRSWW